MKKVKIAIIGGTGFEKQLFKNFEKLRLGTPYGVPPPIFIGKINGKRVAFLPRHGPEHSTPPHKINYRANIYALHKLGVERILATNAVGAINLNFKPGDLVVPHDFVDFTKLRFTTFYDEKPVTHVDFSQPYCPETRKVLIDTAESLSFDVREKAVLICTEGPRYETPAEIEMFRRLGCDIVGMTGVPEAVLARELEICYASLCYVSNMAAGAQDRLTALEVSKISKEVMPKIKQILFETIRRLPQKRNCPCIHALRDARFK
ncbi:S-methyl-5'-thioadenosine phosphorylase [Candidatus Bathyarchaeota archaeon]|nr:S-methyl-5'-thioadenosine phosphorylase [Candidatus Bathyarchaeota archaeon]RJS80377.1 MAG: S-methyl-5'-thioadenosine phosphorylase [Candidatus Bathyarchaeota archaeon]